MNKYDELENTLEKINSLYRQEDPVSLFHKSLDLNGFHFEFEEVFGLAAIETEYGWEFTIIEEDDDQWFIYHNEAHNLYAGCWIKSLKNASKRMNNYIRDHE